jgi:antirestriction protein ArdC
LRSFQPRFSAPKPGSRTPSFRNQAAYIAGWLQRLRDDRRLIVQAAGQAQKAADYILNRTPAE